ncbi:hypothetical protein J6590_041897 [Homalodisca vitripennis]|nr:hypothetical protein J6590_041897 [Homalodisca vitripennis]
MVTQTAPSLQKTGLVNTGGSSVGLGPLKSLRWVVDCPRPTTPLWSTSPYRSSSIETLALRRRELVAAPPREAVPAPETLAAVAALAEASRSTRRRVHSDGHTDMQQVLDIVNVLDRLVTGSSCSPSRVRVTRLLLAAPQTHDHLDIVDVLARLVTGSSCLPSRVRVTRLLLAAPQTHDHLDIVDVLARLVTGSSCSPSRVRVRACSGSPSSRSFRHRKCPRRLVTGSSCSRHGAANSRSFRHRNVLARLVTGSSCSPSRVRVTRLLLAAPQTHDHLDIVNVLARLVTGSSCSPSRVRVKSLLVAEPQTHDHLDISQEV